MVKLSILDWNKLSDKDKKRIAKLKNLTFIAGPREMSEKRIKKLCMEFGKSSPLVFGCLKDEYVTEQSCPQFRALKLETLSKVVDKLPAKIKKKLFILSHFLQHTKYIIEELRPCKVIFINGSWQGPIHYSAEYWAALDNRAEIKLLSPFTDEREAKGYESRIKKELGKIKIFKKGKRYSAKELMKIANEARIFSWEWVKQTGAVLAKSGKVLEIAHNRVLPYEAAQLHEGSFREKHRIPSQENIELHQNNHAELEVLVKVQKQKIDLKETALYVDLFPCPVCAKMLARTDIKEIVYSTDYSNTMGYRILEKCGKKMRRIVI